MTRQEWDERVAVAATSDGVFLTKEECLALYELIDQLSGFNASSVFAWDGSDSVKSTTTAACAKVFLLAGREIPTFKEVESP